jgi:hypothetical protein
MSYPYPIDLIIFIEAAGIEAQLAEDKGCSQRRMSSTKGMFEGGLMHITALWQFSSLDHILSQWRNAVKSTNKA